MSIRIKRAYDPPAKNDGYRVLIDRIWPRGVSKEDADIDEWAKDLAPSTGLRKWFGHDPDKWEEFKHRYRKELESHKEWVDRLKLRSQNKRMTLVYAAKDTEHNNAVVLAELLKDE